jgi:hypothetical protein
VVKLKDVKKFALSEIFASGLWRDLKCATLQRYYTENSKHIFPEKELPGHSPNSFIHVSVCDLQGGSDISGTLSKLHRRIKNPLFQ